ncbi:uncharacterized protein LOC130628990 [Hydractinia symbiolongicarpus]|uniref:uncharacterized protein LOC130628990 n=1 Tax=Hydractinia symbiolongicarpus TaxID=13093 RepID=UPI00254DA96E|nr:uncharacterized protein LOC130628990 [Hydractinia symbiolongicarpus]
MTLRVSPEPAPNFTIAREVLGIAWPLHYIFFGLRVPCITASFSLIQISLLEATKLQLYSKRLQSYTFLSVVIGFHFFLVFTADLILTVFAGTTVFLLVCQVFFLFIGVIMSVTCIYSGRKVISHYSQSKINLQQHIGMGSLEKKEPSKSVSAITSPYIIKKLFGKSNNKPSNIKKVIFQDKSMRKIAVLSICTAIFSLGISASILYSFTLTTTKTPDAMRWFVLQNLLRISEGGMVATMAYIVRRNISFSCCKRSQ